MSSGVVRIHLRILGGACRSSLQLTRIHLVPSLVTLSEMLDKVVLLPNPPTIVWDILWGYFWFGSTIQYSAQGMQLFVQRSWYNEATACLNILSCVWLVIYIHWNDVSHFMHVGYLSSRVSIEGWSYVEGGNHERPYFPVIVVMTTSWACSFAYVPSSTGVQVNNYKYLRLLTF